uniref:NADH-quinone oxidoreductase subunit K n=1 Tax=Schlesneria paludicola TaxID=360056 RepID=A0A7C2P035_9PLAN
MTDPLPGQLAVGAILFALGAVGFLTRRNLILMMLSAEMMLLGVSINLTAFGRHHGNASGQVFTIFVLTVAACEAGLALVLILNLYRRRKSLDVQLWSNLGEPDLPQLAPEDADPPAAPPAPELPHLTPSGPLPKAPVGAWK